MTKNDIRARALAERSALSDEQRELKDRMIFQRAHKHPRFQIASTVHIYYSTSEEVNTHPFIEYAWGIGKQVLVPRMVSHTEFESVVLTRNTAFSTRGNGIQEPVDGEVIEHANLPSDLAVIVPVVAFDAQCYRLGYGRGVYDRFLSSIHSARWSTIGIAYQLQYNQQLGREDHDVPLNAIATEERWYQPT